MQVVEVLVSIEYRSDGPVRRGAVQERVAEAILAYRGGCEDLFTVGEGTATYAGYRVALAPKSKTKPV